MRAAVQEGEEKTWSGASASPSADENVLLLFRAHNRLGVALAQGGELGAALSALRRARVLAEQAPLSAPLLASALVNEAVALLQTVRQQHTEEEEEQELQQRGDEALAMLERAVALREEHCGHAAPETVDVLLDRARALLLLGRSDAETSAAADEAVERLEDCTGDAEQTSHLRLAALTLQIELATRAKRAVEGRDVEELIALSEGDENVLQLVATYYASQNQTKKTLEVLDKMKQETPDLLSQKGMLLMSDNQFDKAQEVLTKALRLAEKDGLQSLSVAKPLWLLALAFQGQKKPHDAQRHLMRLMQLAKKEKDDEFEAKIARQLSIVSAMQGNPNQQLYYLKYAVRLAEPFQELKQTLEKELRSILKT